MKAFLFYVKFVCKLLTEKSAGIKFSQPLSHSATQPLSHSATQPLSHSRVVSMRNILRYFFLFSLFINSGCYLRASMSSINDPASIDVAPPVYKVDSPGGSEFISGSDQYLMTQVKRYKMISSSGSMYREIKARTPNGYVLYSSVQGALISGQEGIK